MRTIVGSHKWGLVKDSATFFEKDILVFKKKRNRKEEGGKREEKGI